jgi:hypothetical protein
VKLAAIVVNDVTVVGFVHCATNTKLNINNES